MLKERFLIQELKNKYGLSTKQIIDCLEEEELDGIPITILNDKKISSLEIIVKYLKENKKLKYKEIAKLLKRKSNSLGSTYKKAKTKKPEKFEDQETSPKIPFSAFKKELSILEAICLHLQKEDYKQVEIAKILGKNPKTIWTTIQRTKNKIK
ncbi:hypothetical protein K9L67_05045 [Candidatus Woesearchaeota archaeon]|nr:hypothetical protein [Candidatus Woesearchaeota archaeon]MCF7901564.1 hypothetical protein [Candidatus Woesearchaeota archaeon]MCF8013324.1 hypothetical protein [Candidatus Woesearchaeota archaeon]